MLGWVKPLLKKKKRCVQLIGWYPQLQWLLLIRAVTPSVMCCGSPRGPCALRRGSACLRPPIRATSPPCAATPAPNREIRPVERGGGRTAGLQRSGGGWTERLHRPLSRRAALGTWSADGRKGASRRRLAQMRLYESGGHERRNSNEIDQHRYRDPSASRAARR